MSSSTTAVLYAATVSVASTASAVPDDVASKRHHLQNGKGFDNPWDSWRSWSAPGIMKAMIARRFSGEANSPDTTPPTVAVRTPEFLDGRWPAAPGSTSTSTGQHGQLRATWLGHACYYVEFPSGLRVLFDPVFSERCSPFSWLGPKRYTPAPCHIDDLPTVDAVVISHSHYDHLDHPTVMRIFKKHPNVHFFAPLGNKKWFVESHVPAEQVTELDWWEEREVVLSPATSGAASVSRPGSDSAAAPATPTIRATISALPCQHTSGRTPFDRAQTLWASWSVTSGGSSVYFAGDTGYRSVPASLDPATDHTPATQPLHPHCPAFAEIGKHRGPFDLGLIPIGAYDPRWIMSPMHADPFDAVEIMRDTRCRRALGMHWGTWVLTEEDVLEPPVKLREALRRRGMAEEGVFDVVEIGESRSFESPGKEAVDWEGREKA